MIASVSKIPTLTLSKIILRPFNLSDAKEVQRQAGNPKVAATTATIPHPYLDGMAEDWISKHNEWFEQVDAVDWAIELKETKKLVGCVSLAIDKSNSRAEIGYWVGEEFWGNGYCSEAAVEAIRYGFDIFSLNKISSRHMAENPGSGRVMQKAGMLQEGYLKQHMYKNGKFVDVVVYGILKDG